MDTSALIMIGAALVFLGAVYLKAPQSAGRGLMSGLALFIEIIPRMVAAFVIAGLIQAVIPREVIAHWMGAGSGLRGILIAMGLGTLTPGGPMMQFPIIASLYASGVAVGPLVAYLSAWALLGFQRVIMWEIPFLGPKVVFVRLIVSLAFPVLAGWLSQLLWGKLEL